MPLSEPNFPPYWLFAWFSANSIDTVQDAAKVLSRASGMREMRKAAERWAEATSPHSPKGLNLVAGTGLRLDDHLTCPNPACRRLQVDVLFRHVWHYFDRVLLPDGIGDLLLHPPKHWEEDYVMKILLGRIEIALHIRALGAVSLVHYYPKPRNSSHEVETPAPQDSWFLALREVEQMLLKEGSYHPEELEPHRYRVEFSDPHLQVSTIFSFAGDLEGVAYDDFQKECAHKVLHEHINSLLEDLLVQRTLISPLGATVWTHAHVLSRIGVPDTADVLFRLSLPSLAHIRTEDLIAIREQEGDSFTAFRAALTKAARELLSHRRTESLDILAQEIANDVIEPELSRLHQKLRSAQRVLARKTVVSIFLSTLATTCGFLLGSPTAGSLAGTGVLLSGSGNAAFKYLDDVDSIRMSDMYFLWKTLGHAE